MNPNQKEVSLVLSSIEDESEFEKEWKDFISGSPVYLTNEILFRKFARLWFSKGISRGMSWTESKIIEMVEKDGTT